VLSSPCFLTLLFHAITNKKSLSDWWRSRPPTLGEEMDGQISLGSLVVLVSTDPTTLCCPWSRCDRCGVVGGRRSRAERSVP
jgi:hypothetical protein